MDSKTFQYKLIESLKTFKDNTAIEYGNTCLTYNQVNKRSDRIAKGILHKGINKGTKIGLLMEDRSSFILAMIGILKAGCMFVPLTRDFPATRLKQMIREVHLQIIITDMINFEEDLLTEGDVILENTLEVMQISQVCSDFLDEKNLWHQEPEQIEVEYSPEDRIYIYFTSGTTGKPKAIVGKNKSLHHFINWEIETFNIGADSRVSQFTTPAFDAFLRDVFVPLCSGGIVCIPPTKDTMLNWEDLINWIEISGINVIHCVPGFFRFINSQNLDKECFKRLQVVLLSGETIHPHDLTGWYDTFDERIQLVNFYGPTETTMIKSYYRIQKSDGQAERIPIGKPMKGCRMYIFDENMNICSELMTGEIYIRTPFRTYGYYNDPAANQEKFIPNPFGNNPNDLLYRTGDLGQLLPDGNLVLSGRVDRQVKIRGIRIEPEEIENLLAKHPVVRESAITTMELPGANHQLCAYITDSNNKHMAGTDLIAQLKSYLSQLLPDYLVPDKLFIVKEIPRKPNGKVDYNKLQDDVKTAETELVAPADNIERKLVDIWSEILDVEKIGVNVSFFELGGNSLNVMGLLSKIHSEFDIRIKLAEIFDSPTIKEQAKIIKDSKNENDKFTCIERAEEKEFYLPSPAQKRLFILQQMQKDSTGYNIPMLIRLEGKLHKEKLEETFRKLIERHESLRTCFQIINGEPYQRIHRDCQFEMTCFDRSSLDLDTGNHEAGTGESQSRDRIIGQFIIPFDLAKAPLIRVGLIKTGEDSHILMVDMHHIITDGVSHVILIKEFTDLYNGEKLPEVKLQYKDFSQWQNSTKQKHRVEGQKSYWLTQFADEIPVLDIPTDYDRPGYQDFAGSVKKFEIDREETGALENLALDEGTTLYMVMLAAFNVFLAKITNQEDIVVGTVIAGRTHEGLDNINGIFVNTIALRNYLYSEKKLNDFIQQVKENTLQAFENQDYPFEELVEQVSVNRDASRNPLFDVMFVMQNMEFPAVQIPGLTLRPYEYENRISKFDLTMQALEIDGKLVCALEYCTKLFKAETIERFIGYFKMVLSSLLANPNETVSRIEVLPEGEKNKVLFDFNSPYAEYPREKTLQQLFAEQVARYPDNIAAAGTEPGSDWNDQFSLAVSYKNLDTVSDQWAEMLMELGVRPDSPVGLMIEPSLEMMAAILAVLKAGGAYLPIDPDYPHDRVFFILEDSCSHILLTRGKLATGKDKINQWNGKTICMDHLPVSSLPHNSAPIQDKPEASRLKPASSLAYIIYTSGTTGKPKGVLIEHRNVVRLLFNDKFQFDFSPRDVWTLFHSYCFDFSVWEMYGALLYGGQLVILPKLVTRDPAGYLAVLTKKGVTVLNQTPSAFYNLIDEEAGKANKELYLRYVIFGGEALKPVKLKKWKARYPGTRLINMYGITETTVHVTFKEISQAEIATDTSNIGKPIPTLSTYIMDKNQRLLPIGTPGELCVAGDGVGRGYLNRPELTADKFLENPCKPREKLYRSGDLAKLNENGEMEYSGRIDNQVKIRGFRIELGEIESKLLKREEIKEAVILAREDQTGGRYLCAYLVSDRELIVSALREHLSRELPEYMIPAYFVPLERLPLTSNGKIDRKALPDPRGLFLETDGDYAPSGNELEKKLVEIWETVLGKARIGINDNFFMIGGDSIKTIQIASRMNEAGYRVEMKDFFSNPTIKELATRVKMWKPVTEQEAVLGHVPLTPIQHWFFQNNFAGFHHYNQAVMLCSVEEQGFAEKMIRAVFTKLAEHHDALRMTFKEEHNERRQFNNGLDYPLDLQVFDLRKHANTREAVEAKASEIQAGINLETGPLMKLGLFHLGERDLLLIAIHHLVVDGVSWRILFEDLDILCQQYKNKEPLTLPLKTDSYKLRAEKLCEYANSKKFLEEKAYWAELEGSAKKKRLQPIKKDYQESLNYLKDAEHQSFRLNEEQTRLLLTGVNRAFNTEINDILLTALGLAIKETFGNDRFAVALEGHGREDILENIDITRTIGWFTSIYPVILDFSMTGGIDRQIKEVKETLRQVPNKGIGYGIMKYLTAGEHLAGMLFNLKPQISFNYLGQFDTDISHKSFGTAKEPCGKNQCVDNQRPYEIDVMGLITGHCLTMSLEYNKNQFRGETINALANSFHTHLTTIIAYCSGRESRQLTPGDFIYHRLSIEQVDQLQSQYENLLEEIYPLSPLQEGMLFHSLYDTFSPVYFVQISYRMHENLDITNVKQSLNELVKRYDILRTAFIYKGLERPLQLVLKHRPMEILYEDLRNLDTGNGKKAREMYIKNFKKIDRYHPFDLSKDMLIRVAIFRVDDAEYEFTWSYHHILTDGWCTGILIADYFEIYYSFLENRPYQLNAIKPYRRYILWLENQDKEESGNFWQKYLEGYEETSGFPRPRLSNYNRDGYNKREVVFALDDEDSHRLAQVAVANQVTINTVIQAAWGITLGKYCGQQDVVFGVVVSGRPSELEGVETMVGLFINTIPVRIRFREGMKFSQLLQQVQEKAIEGEPHHYYPLAKIQGSSALKQNLLDHILAFENYPIARQIKGLMQNHRDSNRGSSLKISRVDRFEQTNYDFNVVILPSEQLVIKFEFNAHEYDYEYVQTAANYFKGLLSRILEDEHQTVEQLTLLSEEDRRHILYDFNQHDIHHPMPGYTGEKTIHELFAFQVSQQPDAIALVDENQQVTYDHLNRKANQLARQLRSRGVGADVPVGIMLTPSIHMVTAVIGVLKAGGAYLPLDPEVPVNRLLSILEDSGAGLLLTENQAIKNYKFAALKGGQSGRNHTRSEFTGPRAQIRDLNQLCMPDRSLVDYEKYSDFIGQAMVKHAISLQATRGCPYACTYCHKIWPKKHVVRSAGDIFEEVQCYYKMGIRRFAFTDDIFNLDVKNSTRFFQLIIENGLEVQLFFPNGMRGDILTREYIDLMVKAGTVNLAIALETASPRLQDLIQKNLDLEKVGRNIEYITSTYPHVILELFTIHGFPTESEEEACMTLDFIKRFHWLHFPYVFILKIYPNTDMAKLAMDNGISPETINNFEDLAFHELPDTLPFKKSFTLKYQAEFLNEYFLSKERLRHVLPYQMKILTEDELVQKYNSYLPVNIKSLDDLLKFVGIDGDELNGAGCVSNDQIEVPGLAKKMKAYFSGKSEKPGPGALRVLLLDLSQYFSTGSEAGQMLYDVVDPPLGLMYLLTHLRQRFGGGIRGKIAKSRIDFDSFRELKLLLEEFQPEVIGIRSLTFYKDFFHKTVSVMRQWGITVPIIAGGPYATSSYKMLLQDRNVDLVVVGEGEITFSEIIGKIRENAGRLPVEEELEKIPGIAFIPHCQAKKMHPGDIIVLDELQQELNSNSVENPGNINQADDLAYILFTSGSTGNPKGVMLEHGNVINLVHGLNERIYKNSSQKQRFCLVSPIVFDASVKQVFGALLLGHSLHIVPKYTRIDGAALLQYYRKHQINVSDGTPVHLRILTESIGRNHEIPGINYFLIGGEALSRETVLCLFNQFSGQEKPTPVIINVYGPTECCVDATSYQITDNNIETLDIIPIGRPMPNHRIYITDSRDRLQPIGAAGEIQISGLGAARGYLNDPGLTLEKFINSGLQYTNNKQITNRWAGNMVPNEKLLRKMAGPGAETAGFFEKSFPGRRGQKRYKTGDLARWLADGNIEFLGRIDHQVKIRGFRIESGEIEAQLVKHAEIKEAVVVVRENGEKYLCAYIVSARELAASELRAYLSRYLPEYMVPSYFVQVDRIPLTTNGKVDRKALDTHGTALVSGVEYAAPGSKPEKLVARIWQEVLRLDKIGIHDNFFDLGGDSIKVITLNSKLSTALGREIPIAEMFEHVTIHSFVQYLSREQGGESDSIQVERRAEKLIESKKRRAVRRERRAARN